MRISSALWTPTLLALASCQTLALDEIEPALEYDETAAEIVNGSLPTDSPEHRAVVALLFRQGNQVSEPFCTGTLISDTVVLTAAHCVEESPLTGLPMTAADVAIYLGNDPNIDLSNETVYGAVEVAFHPEYDPVNIVNDIAVVVIEEPAAVPPIPPLPPVIGFTPTDIGARLNFAGFGQTETESSGVKLQTDGIVGGMGCVVEGCPGISDVNTLFSYAMKETGPCFGDSGGPAFLYRGNKPYVAGVTSYGDQNCTLYGASTRVDAFLPWISQFTGVDTAPPVLAISKPGNNATVGAGFKVTVDASDDEGIVRMDLYVDGLPIQTLMSEPWVFTTSKDMALGAHGLQVVAYDSANVVATTLNVVVEESAGGCSATGGQNGTGLVLLALAILFAVRRRPELRAVRQSARPRSR